MKRKLLSLLSAFLLTVTAFAGTPLVRNCGTMENLDIRKAEDPGLAARMQQIEAQTAAYLLAHKYETNTTNAVITIPVVFHVVYSSSGQNISDAQCQAQVEQLNLDYARLNADRTNTPSVWSTVAANTNIQFCLAQRDPSGNATTGIERRSTTVTSWSTNDYVKYYSRGGLDAWPASSYLNIWSCNLSNGILGYAQFPGGASATDGVVLLFSSIGSVNRPGTTSPYNLGRTATHEVGHWLNLYHIWGDDGSSCSGSDNVGDTPNQAGENYGCPTYPKTDACTSTSPGVMFMNYMDYTDDGCMNMFTAGQSSRMNALFATGGARASLVSSLGCTAPSGCGTPTGLAASSITTSSATLSWTAVSTASSYIVTYTPSGGTATTVSTTSTSVAVSGLPSATSVSWQVNATCTSGNSANATSSFTTASTTSCGTPASLTSSSITSSGATLSWGAVSGATSYTVSYSPSGGTATTVNTTSTSVSLTGLVASTPYSWQVRATCSTGTGSFSAAASFTTSAASTTCSDPYESNNSSTAARTISTNTNINALISSSTDKDWFKFTTVSPNTNINITLTNLPADYDIRLYNSSLTQLAISQNNSTTSETIIRNTTAAGTYYIQVYGYNGANSTSSCYTMRVSVSSSTFRTEEEIMVNPTEKLAANDLIVYPNPSHESVNAEFNAVQSEVAHVRIFDMMGKSVVTNDISVNEGINKFNFDLSELTKGIYFIEMNSSAGRQVKKFILEK